MIVKHVPMRTLGKSDFAGLVTYLTSTQNKTERIGAIQITNCQSGTLQAAIDEVLATQHLNTRAKSDKTYHLLVSFRAGENPSSGTLKAIEERICVGLGLGEHQRISTIHHDTDNLHFHIAINKIHPVRLTICEPYYQHFTLAKLCTNLEQEYGLERDNHESRKKVAEGRATDMECHAGIESLIGWIKRGCFDELKDAQTWSELHKIMNDNDLVLHKRANGFVIEAGDGTIIKASSLDRAFSKPKLEARLGAFEPAPSLKGQAKGERIYNKDPVRTRVNTVELYAKYKAEKENLTTVRANALATAKIQKDEAIKNAKRSSQLRRATIKIVDSKGINKKVLYAQANSALRAKLQSINQDYAEKRENIFQGFKRLTWADWLKREAVNNNTEALAALRARKAAQGLKGNTVQGEGQSRPGAVQVKDNITKKGTIIFRAGRSAIRDDGNKLQVSRETTPESLQAALRLAMERYGERITVNGNPEFKAQMVKAAVALQLPITFVNPGLERRRQELIKKEQQSNERTERHNNTNDRGRTNRRGPGSYGTSFANQHLVRPRTDDNSSIMRLSGKLGKPNISRLGSGPPPQNRNRLRTLSQLGLVHLANGSKMLLPGDVSHNMEQQGAKPDQPLRRAIFGARIKQEQLEAMDKYIAEREAKRLIYNDIPKHCRCEMVPSGVLTFAGVRNVEGQSLALLRNEDSVIMVLPVDPATIRRLSRLAVGDQVSITTKGSIQTTSKGRGR